MQSTSQDLLKLVLSSSDHTYSQHQGIAYQLVTRKNSAEEATLQLIIRNATNKSITFKQIFPMIDITLQDPSCSYLFPMRGAVFSSKSQTIQANFGGIINTPFFSCYDRFLGGLMVYLHDNNGEFKLLTLKKTDRPSVSFNVTHSLFIKAGETIELPHVTLKVLKKSCLEAIDIYKKYYKQKFEESNPIQMPSTIFHQTALIRVLQIYEQYWHEQDKRCNGKLTLVECLEEDEKLLGKLQFVHLWDWSAKVSTPPARVGNYLTERIVGDGNLEKLNQEIHSIKARGTQVGLYIQGYLINKSLQKQIKINLKANQLLDRQGRPYTNWGSDNYTLCPGSPEWQNLVCHSLANLTAKLPVKCFYIDQFGFGQGTSPYRCCSNNSHEHSAKFDLQLCEIQMLSKLRKELGKQSVIQTEQIPCDTQMRLLSGSLSGGAKQVVKANREVPILLTRFIYPWFKVVELITEYSMCSSDQLSTKKVITQSVDELAKMIKVAIWNANAIYVPKKLQKYDERLLDMLKRYNLLFQKYCPFFTSMSVEALINIAQWPPTTPIFLNKFTSNERNIYTAINWSQTERSLSAGEKDIEMKGWEVAILADHFDVIQRF